MSKNYPVFNVDADGIKKKTKDIGFAACRNAAEDMLLKKHGIRAAMILEYIPDSKNDNYSGFAWTIDYLRR